MALCNREVACDDLADAGMKAIDFKKADDMTGHAPTGTGVDVPQKSSRRLKRPSTITWRASEIP